MAFHVYARDILYSALKFKDIVDTRMALDPSEYSTIVWTIISAGLQMLKYYNDRRDAVFESAAILAKLLPKYFVVEEHYLDWKINQQAAFRGSIISVYTALLRFAYKINKELGLEFRGKQFLIRL